jgi:hypothetical protein
MALIFETKLHTFHLSAKPQKMCDIHIAYSKSEYSMLVLGSTHCHVFSESDSCVQKKSKLTPTLLLLFVP